MGAQHPGHRAIRHRLTQPGQSTGQVPGRLGGPHHQQRHRIPPASRGPPAPAAPPPGRDRSGTTSCGHPRARALAAPARPVPEFPHATRDRVRVRPGGRRDRLHPAPPQFCSLGPQQQPTLTLIQVWTQHLVPTYHGFRHLRALGQNTTVGLPEFGALPGGALRGRRELHRDRQEAMDSAGKAALFSGMTVLISLSAVMLVPSPAFRSMAPGIMLAVILVLAATHAPARGAGQARRPRRRPRASLGPRRGAPLTTVRRAGRTVVEAPADLRGGGYGPPRSASPG